MNNIIREVRTKKGLRQEDLAALIGVSRQTINAIEKGKYDPSLTTAFRLSEHLEMPIDQLFHYRSNPSKE